MAQSITRRAAPMGAIASSAALAAPAIVAAPPMSEDPYERARRLSKELSQALTDIEAIPWHRTPWSPSSSPKVGSGRTRPD